MYEEKKKRAREKLDRILRTGRLNGVDLRLSRGHDRGWAPPLNPGWYGIPDGNRKFLVAPATVSVDGFLRLQGSTSSSSLGMFLSGAYGETVERAKQSVRTGSYDIPTPVIELRTDGTIPQEGRSRAVGARDAGVERMPVWIAVKVYK